ncbi:MAG: hypothetical protein EOM20_10700 [Spartobacteria bacterium]|nr:hypothetical protein [Spartobacteria bacterium]
MNQIRTIMKRDWPAIILVPSGLTIMTIFLALAGYLFASQVAVTQQATLRYLFRSLGLLCVLVAPLITMRLLAEELHNGTFEVLATAPLRDRDIVLGKFLAGWKCFTLWTLPMFGYLLALEIVGAPDWGAALAGYIGLQLLAALLIAIGLFCSSLTSSQILAAMAAILVGLALSLSSGAAHHARGAMRGVLLFLDTQSHLGVFRRGVLDTRSIFFFVGTTAMFLYLTIRSIESRRWKFGVVPGALTVAWRHRTLACALFALAGLLLLHLVFVRASGRLWTAWQWAELTVLFALALVPLALNRKSIAQFLQRRRYAVVVTVLLNSLLVLAVWGLLMFLASRHYYRKDLTADNRHVLSAQTVALLKTLETPLEIYIIEDEPADLFQQINDLADEYAAHNKLIVVNRIDPNRQPAYIEKLQRRFNLPAEPKGELIIAYRDDFRRIPARAMVTIPFAELRGRVVRGAPRFDGEAELTGVLLNMLHTDPGRVVFLAGHGERDPWQTGPQGLSAVAERLRKSGWTVDRRVISPGRLATFADDAKVVVVAGPRRSLSDENRAALGQFLDRGGGVLLMLEPHQENGLEALIEPWNVRIGRDIVVDLSDYAGQADPTSLYVSRFEETAAVGKAMSGLAVVMPTARRISVTRQNLRPEVTVRNFMHTSGSGWAVYAEPHERFSINPERDRRGPISLGAMCERYQELREPGREPLRGRLLVLGDADFAVNQYVDMAGNLDLFLNGVDWLADRQGVLGARPKAVGAPTLTMTRAHIQLLFWVSVVVIPAGALLIGVSALRKRRKAA